jgi:transitional endoplasmic reticulum ATPase
MIMENLKLLNDSLNSSIENYKRLIDKDDYSGAKKQLEIAYLNLLRIAKLSEGNLRTIKLNEADRIQRIIEALDLKIENSKLNKKQTKTKENSEEQDGQEVTFKPTDASDVTFDDVAGLEVVKDEIRKKIIEPFRNAETYKKFDLEAGGGILLFGLPGTGKTMIAQALANEIKAKFFVVNSSDIMSKWVGASEKNIKQLFDEARKHPLSIIFFDEFEAIGAKRDTDSTVMKRVIPELLAQIQGFQKHENKLLIFAATNRPWDIDTAFTRPGRFNVKIHVPLPDLAARERIIRNILIDNRKVKIPVETNIDLKTVIDLMEGFNGADVSEICKRAKERAADREISSKTSQVITFDDLYQTTVNYQTSVDEKDVKRLNDYLLKNKLFDRN